MRIRNLLVALGMTVGLFLYGYVLGVSGHSHVRHGGTPTSGHEESGQHEHSH